VKKINSKVGIGRFRMCEIHMIIDNYCHLLIRSVIYSRYSGPYESFSLWGDDSFIHIALSQDSSSSELLQELVFASCNDKLLVHPDIAAENSIGY
jgi:hypothetical protein